MGELARATSRCGPASGGMLREYSDLEPPSTDCHGDEELTDWVLPSAVDAMGRPFGYSLLALIRRRTAPLMSMVFRLIPF